MQYRIDKKSGNKLSVLGMGCMRFKRTLAGIDQKKADALIMAAVEKGVNYFDTAWMYPGSEESLGAALEKNGVRDKVFIASKLPIILVKKPEDFDRFFNEELKRLRTDHIDYYLMHMLTDLDSWKSLAALGIEVWIDSKKKSGQIRQIGFSFHGSEGEFYKILEAYPWEFCQIQYNYSDENFQAGVRGLKKASESMPVIIMEPLLGGKLAGGLPKAAQEIFQSFSKSKNEKTDKKLSPAAWGLKWLWNQNETAVVLSGMSEISQVEENAAIADTSPAASLSAGELDVYRRVREVFNASYKIHCTACGYCMPCPRNVNIPGCFAAYNHSFSIGWVGGMKQYITGTAVTSAKSGVASNCVSCGKCEGHCPQKIPIRSCLKAVRKRMEPVPIRIIIAAARKFLGKKRA
jgi:predicted aldo/keto reductase-like oxidoreductase